MQPWCDSPDFLTEFDQLSFNGGAEPLQGTDPHLAGIRIGGDNHLPDGRDETGLTLPTS